MPLSDNQNKNLAIDSAASQVGAPYTFDGWPANCIKCGKPALFKVDNVHFCAECCPALVKEQYALQ